MPEFGNFLLLTGHGLSRYLSETGSDVVTTGPDGTIRGKAKGLYAGAILGEVNATLVGDDLPIVRQASLMESNSPVLEIQTTGTVQGEDGLPYARQGILRNYTVRGPAGSYDISLTKLFRVRRVHASDQDLVRVKQEQSYELHPDTTSVIDFRGGKQKISNLQRPGKLSEVENLIEN
jgi:hypothetical protein